MSSAWPRGSMQQPPLATMECGATEGPAAVEAPGEVPEVAAALHSAAAGPTGAVQLLHLPAELLQVSHAMRYRARSVYHGDDPADEVCGATVSTSKLLLAPAAAVEVWNCRLLTLVGTKGAGPAAGRAGPAGCVEPAAAGRLLQPLPRPRRQVRKTPGWPRSWANFSLLSLCSHRNECTGQPASSGPAQHPSRPAASRCGRGSAADTARRSRRRPGRRRGRSTAAAPAPRRAGGAAGAGALSQT
jgi:hypothetical protein